MTKISGSLPSDLHEKLVIFRDEWRIFAVKTLKMEAIHAFPRHILVYDLETTKNFEPKFHGFLSYDIAENKLSRYGLIPIHLLKSVAKYVGDNREWLETYSNQRYWAEVFGAIFPKPEGFAILTGLNLLYFDLKRSDLQTGQVGNWKVEENKYTYTHEGKPLEYVRINALYMDQTFLHYNFDLLPLATQAGFKKGEKKVEQMANKVNKYFFKMPNPPTLLKPLLGKEEIDYCINDCLVELELFAHISNKILKQVRKS
jgi:hypothetical protein